MRILLIILLVSISNILFSRGLQTLENDTVIESEKKVMSKTGDTLLVNKFLYKKSLVKMESFYSNGMKESLYYFKDGYMEGKVEEFSKNGQIIYKGNRKANKIVGKSSYWYDDGSLKSVVFIVNDKGLLVSYFNTGELMDLQQKVGQFF